MGACHIALGAACLGAYPGVGAFHSTRQNSYLGAYPGVGAYPGYYGNVPSGHCKVKIDKIKCDIFNIGRQKPFGHAGENAAMPQSKIR